MTKRKYIFWTVFNLLILFGIAVIIAFLLRIESKPEDLELSYSQLLKEKNERTNPALPQTDTLVTITDTIIQKKPTEKPVIQQDEKKKPNTEKKQLKKIISKKDKQKTETSPVPSPIKVEKKPVPIPKIIPYEKEILNCTDGDCHEDIMDKRFVHIPVEEIDCVKCHSEESKAHSRNPEKPFTETIENIAERCYTCHNPALNIEDVHDPVAKGQCLTCHNPHQSTAPKLMKGKQFGIICKECHTLNIEEKDWVHGPVAVGACGVCHISHGSVSNSLLIQSKTDVCYSCHSIKKEEFESYTFLHGPVAVSCSGCHNPHASNNKYQLKTKKENLCYYCHSDLQNMISESNSKHKPLEDEKTCYNCHASHGSNYKYNLLNNTFDLCLTCHNKDVQKGSIKIPAITKLLKENSNWHGPIRDKDCSGCHVPHGSKNIKLLKLNYPEGFYSEFNVENYKLCFMCHPETNVLDKTTTKLTNFRNGDVNLHYLHVNQKKGRTCRACHQIHASNLSFHIRDAVPFGDWKLPINFIPSDNGGSCLPGCHRKFEYKR